MANCKKTDFFALRAEDANPHRKACFFSGRIFARSSSEKLTHAIGSQRPCLSLPVKKQQQGSRMATRKPVCVSTMLEARRFAFIASANDARSLLSLEGPDSNPKTLKGYKAMPDSGMRDGKTLCEAMALKSEGFPA